MRTWPRSASSCGVNSRRPRPISTSAVGPSGVFETKAWPDGSVSVRSGALITRLVTSYSMVVSSASRNRPLITDNRSTSTICHGAAAVPGSRSSRHVATRPSALRSVSVSSRRRTRPESSVARSRSFTVARVTFGKVMVWTNSESADGVMPGRAIARIASGSPASAARSMAFTSRSIAPGPWTCAGCAAPASAGQSVTNAQATI